MTAAFPWTCPFCHRDTTITVDYYYSESEVFQKENAHGPHIVQFQFVVCPNPKCRQFSFTTLLFKVKRNRENSGWIRTQQAGIWRLIPSSSAKAIPEYVPKAIRDDYGEACAIVDLSPKASATLARRCLQGMIADFWDIKRRPLARAVNALKGKVSAASWKAIDAVRSIGNIGAHMEKDINVIVDVELGEAEKLIWLIEFLLDDWYVRRDEENKRLQEIADIAAEKEGRRKGGVSEAAGQPLG